MREYQVEEIGKTITKENEFFIQLFPTYREGLKGLEGFSHVNVLYWLDQTDIAEFREILTMEQPYKGAPDILGTFATRAPIRPNPIALTVAKILAIDENNGLVQVDYLDAENNSPLLDLKPYTPSADRVETPSVPEWCATWPKNVETSGEFDWSTVFNFV
jgi:tRNA-Thr(GGU) m(6)t(6)A37 methyltransferase TsaA